MARVSTPGCWRLEPRGPVEAQALWLQGREHLETTLRFAGRPLVADGIAVTVGQGAAVAADAAAGALWVVPADQVGLMGELVAHAPRPSLVILFDVEPPALLLNKRIPCLIVRGRRTALPEDQLGTTTQLVIPDMDTVFLTRIPTVWPFVSAYLRAHGHIPSSRTNGTGES